MLKIPKGLKKKKKGKKKKDQELFTEEELEQYKQEQTKKAAEAAVAVAATSGADNGEGGKSNEEWSNFAKITSGIDSIVKKTQDDLDRIKTTSFFQRVAPKIETENVEPEEDEETKKARELEALKSAVVELSESEYESDDDTSVFDADYMDKVGATELPLAYIPDSPEVEEAEGDDPFDTTYAEKVMTGPKVSKSGKKIVSIGSEVLQVLTGAVDNIPKSTITKRPKRRGIQNLMLSSFDKDAEDDDAPKESIPDKGHDMMDDLFELPQEENENVEIDLSVSLHMKFKENNPEAKKEEEHEQANNNDDVLKEFDVLKDEEDDEFGQLAAESLAKPAESVQKVVDVIPLVPPQSSQETTDWAEFKKDEVEIDDDLGLEAIDDDPFNTEFAEACLPKVDSFEELAKESLSKRSESISKPTESNLMDSNDNPVIHIVTDEIRRDELARRKSSLSLSINASKAVQFAVPTPDPMKSDIEFSALIKKPLTPYYAQEKEEEHEADNVDPFDTSFVPNVSFAPSQLELNYIEKDLLKSTINDLEDDSFDPRAVTPIPVEQVEIATETSPSREEMDPFGNAMFDDDKYSAVAVIDDASKEVKTVTDVGDILTNTLDVSVVDAKVLTPQMNPSDSFEIADIDPFDTTFAENIRPGEAEIKIIESELIS